MSVLVNVYDVNGRSYGKAEAHPRVIRTIMSIKNMIKIDHRMVKSIDYLSYIDRNGKQVNLNPGKDNNFEIQVGFLNGKDVTIHCKGDSGPSSHHHDVVKGLGGKNIEKKLADVVGGAVKAAFQSAKTAEQQKQKPNKPLDYSRIADIAKSAAASVLSQLHAAPASKPSGQGEKDRGNEDESTDVSQREKGSSQSRHQNKASKRVSFLSDDLCKAVQSLLTSVVEGGGDDNTSMSEIINLLQIIDNPETRRKLMYIRNKWVITKASPCGQNLCWLSSCMQSCAGKQLSQNEIFDFRKMFMSWCSFLNSSFDDKNLKHLFFARDENGKPAGSQDAGQSRDSIRQKVERRTKGGCNLQGEYLDLRLLATLLLTEIHVHKVPSISTNVAANFQPPVIEEIVVIEPLGMQRCQAGRVVHVQHTMNHFDSILGVAGSFRFMQSADMSPETLLAAAKAHIAQLVKKCSPDALANALKCNITDVDHCPIVMRERARSDAIDLTGTNSNNDKPKSSSSSSDTNLQSLQQQVAILTALVQKQQESIGVVLQNLRQQPPSSSSLVQQQHSLPLLPRQEQQQLPNSSGSNGSNVGESNSALGDSVTDANGNDITGGGDDTDLEFVEARLVFMRAKLDEILKGSVIADSMAVEALLEIKDNRLLECEPAAKDATVSALAEEIGTDLTRTIRSAKAQQTRCANKMFQRLARYVAVQNHLDNAGKRALLEKSVSFLQTVSLSFSLNAAALTKTEAFSDAEARAVLPPLNNTAACE